MADPTAQTLATLAEPARTAAFNLVYAARMAGYPVIVTSGRRSLSEQQRLVAAGRSKTLKSRHVDGQAFDIDWYGFDRNDVPGWFWQLIGPWAITNLRLRWGGEFSGFFDPGHFEVPR